MDSGEKRPCSPSRFTKSNPPSSPANSMASAHGEHDAKPQPLLALKILLENVVAPESYHRTLLRDSRATCDPHAKPWLGVGAGEGIRTLDPSAWEADALPLSYSRIASRHHSQVAGALDSTKLPPFAQGLLSLGSVDISSWPYESADKVEESEVPICQLVESGEDAAVVLDSCL